MTTNTAMLVVVDATDTNDYLLEQAIAQARKENATLVVAHVIPERLYQARQNALAAVPNLTHDGTNYTIEVARGEALAIASRTAKGALDDSTVEYTAVGAVGNLTTTLTDLAAVHACGTIILPAERSWWRRRMGSGDRKLARAFDGTVLRVPRSEPQLIDGSPAVVES